MICIIYLLSGLFGVIQPGDESAGLQDLSVLSVTCKAGRAMSEA